MQTRQTLTVRGRWVVDYFHPGKRSSPLARGVKKCLQWRIRYGGVPPHRQLTYGDVDCTPGHFSCETRLNGNQRHMRKYSKTRKGLVCGSSCLDELGRQNLRKRINVPKPRTSETKSTKNGQRVLYLCWWTCVLSRQRRRNAKRN